MSLPRQRGQFEGMLNIVRFNWPFYVGAFTAITCATALLALAPMPRELKLVLGAGAAGAAWLLVSSLLVSHWIYDRSRLYRWDWLREIAGEPKSIANVHAGFDESSEGVRATFPEAELRVFDFYDPKRNTEPSIARARRVRPARIAATPVKVDALPLADASCALLLLILAAHELRVPADRLALFAEIRRILAPRGRAVLVEHLRDFANFAVFGPGFLHFLPRREWLRVIAASRLRVVKEFSITPFVRVFVFERSC